MAQVKRHHGHVARRNRLGFILDECRQRFRLEHPRFARIPPPLRAHRLNLPARKHDNSSHREPLARALLEQFREPLGAAAAAVRAGRKAVELVAGDTELSDLAMRHSIAVLRGKARSAV